jgi:hypothetical protein
MAEIAYFHPFLLGIYTIRRMRLAVPSCGIVKA